MSEKNKKNTGAEEIHWDLSDLYKSIDDPQLEQDRETVLEKADEFAETYKGRITELDSGQFKKALQEYEDILEMIGKIGSFAHLLWSTNTSKPEYGKLIQQSKELSSEVHQKLVFFDVEWLDVEEEKAGQWIESDELSHYKHYLETSRRYKEHILSEKEEQILSAKSVTGRSAWNRYFDETLGAAKFELEGEELTEQEVLSKLHEPNRELRKKA
ncbi:MAG TPA: hypothetical protein VJ905_13945, partial [Halalkalibaculum sp.]|nr:hypothetical protein [Halalkalibaculum sp.]